MNVDLLKALIKESEGCRQRAYKDSGGVWTIGYGHTGPEVKEGLIWSQNQCEAQLTLDLLEKGVTPALNACPVLRELPDECLTAIADMFYNCTLAHLLTSTLRKRINERAFDAVPGEIRRWIRDSAGKIQPGLVKRREQDASLWIAGLAKYEQGRSAAKQSLQIRSE